MRTFVGRIMGAGGAMALSALTFGTTLQLDGILMVKGMSMADARVIIVTPHEQPRILTDNLDHFNLHLSLNTEYLISFERPGCVSKQLQFNTTVPKGYPVGEGFYFPFQVTLEPMPKGQRFSYAGPVGYIHFDKDINAFSYDTDYRIAKDEVLTQRLELARTELDRSAPSDMKPAEATVGVTEPTEKRQTPQFEVMAPVVSKVAPMVHVLETPQEAVEPAPMAIEPMTITIPEIVPRKPVPELFALGPVAAVREIVPAAVPYRWKDVQADRLHVITTIKVMEDGVEMEYRRVVSYYGGMIYFRNGLPCTEAVYQQGIAH